MRKLAATAKVKTIVIVFCLIWSFSTEAGGATVPNVVGMTEPNATTAITGAGLVLGTASYACSDIVAADDVISQDPNGGTTVPPASSVDIVVSTGQPSVPDLTGYFAPDATAIINGISDVSFGTATNQCDDVFASGTVIGQSETGTVACGTVINLTISTGQPTVPDVTGTDEASAIATINARPNISYGTSTYQCSDTVPSGDVISQSVTGIASCGSTVDLVVSTGQPSVPDVTGGTIPEAIAIINSISDVSFGTTISQCDASAPGTLIGQSETGTVACGTVINLSVSRGEPTVPDVTGADEASATAAINAISDISVGTVSYTCSNTVAAGDVISQSVTGTAPCGTAVDLLVSTGQPTVPDVTGIMRLLAITAINAVDDISAGTVTYACSDTVLNNRVISQSITGTAPCGTIVDLVVSTGQPTVPDVTGLDEATAISTINAVSDISYGSSTTPYDEVVPLGDVISQSVTGTAACGTVVNLVVSNGLEPPVITDNFDDNSRAILMWSSVEDDPNVTSLEEVNQRLELISDPNLASILASSLVGHWKLNDNAANTTVVDSSDNGNDGVARRNTDLLHTTGKIDGAFRFNGTDEYVDVSDVIGTGAYTKSAWIKRADAVAFNNIISSGLVKTHALFAPSGQGFTLCAGHNTNFRMVQDTVPLDPDVWYHVAVTFDPNGGAGILTLYKDGVEVDRATNVPTQNPSLRTYIGKFDTSFYFNGSIDNAMVFDRAITSEEIEDLYNEGNGTELFLGSRNYLAADYSSNIWSIDPNGDFEVQIDYHYSDVSFYEGWVGIRLTDANDGDYVSFSVGSDTDGAHFYADSTTVTDSNSRSSTDGTLYLSYDSALDELYLSSIGFGSGQAWQTITGLFGGSGSVEVAIGGGSDRVKLLSGDAYLDNFEVSGTVLDWPHIADLNGDGFIDVLDIGILGQHWLEIGPGIVADMYPDNQVNSKDFAIFRLNWYVK